MDGSRSGPISSTRALGEKNGLAYRSNNNLLFLCICNQAGDFKRVISVEKDNDSAATRTPHIFGGQRDCGEAGSLHHREKRL